MSASSTRSADRRPIQCDLTEYLVTTPDRTRLRCMATNVSRNGLGIVGFSAVAPGTDLILVVKEKGVPLKVVWCKKDPAKEGIFHIGIESQDPRHNLVTLLESAKLIKLESQLPPFATLRPVIAALHTHDQATLHDGGLAKLAKSFRAYPFNFKGLSLAALVPIAMRPADFGAMEADEAARHLIILMAERKGVWQRVWPEKATPQID